MLLLFFAISEPSRASTVKWTVNDAPVIIRDPEGGAVNVSIFQKGVPGATTPAEGTFFLDPRGEIRRQVDRHVAALEEEWLRGGSRFPSLVVSGAPKVTVLRCTAVNMHCMRAHASCVLFEPA